MSGYLFLGIAIAAEVVATTSMKALDGFNKPLPLILVVCGYGLSLWLLSIVVKTIPIGVAYAVWSGLGVVLITAVSWVLFGQKLDAAALIGMGLIVAGVVVMNVFSKAVGH